MQPLFKSPHAALTFAYSKRHGYERPLMNRMGAASNPGNGLGGLDGAGQAGLIRAEVQRLGELREALVIARFAPRIFPCSCKSACCKGYRPNREWQAAITTIAEHARNTALADCNTTPDMRYAYVERVYMRKDARKNLENLAKDLDVNVKTIWKHAKHVRDWLAGTRGKGGVPGMEDAAINAIYETLINSGLCER